MHSSSFFVDREAQGNVLWEVCGSQELGGLLSMLWECGYHRRQSLLDTYTYVGTSMSLRVARCSPLLSAIAT